MYAPKIPKAKIHLIFPANKINSYLSFFQKIFSSDSLWILAQILYSVKPWTLFILLKIWNTTKNQRLFIWFVFKILQKIQTSKVYLTLVLKIQAFRPSYFNYALQAFLWNWSRILIISTLNSPSRLFLSLFFSFIYHIHLVSSLELLSFSPVRILHKNIRESEKMEFYYGKKCLKKLFWLAFVLLWKNLIEFYFTFCKGLSKFFSLSFILSF